MSNGSSSPRHFCDYSECGKSFRRAEHLNRHKLNHTNSTIKCPQCDHLFYRRDLLKRHLILKHRKSPRSIHPADLENSASFETSPPGSHDDKHSPGLSAYSFQEAGEPSPPPAMLAANIPATGANVGDVVMPAVSGSLFPFPSPGIELTPDWAWLHQYPFPVLPVSSGAQIASNNEIAPFQCLNDNWIDPQGPSGLLYISQEVYDYIVRLRSIAEANHPLAIQDVASIFNTAFLFIMQSLPIFHQPTFSFDLIRRELCASIFCVGLLITPKQELHQMGCALLGQVRSGLLKHVDENTIYLRDLEILESMLLVEFAGMYLADRVAVELSDIFHGTLVTLSRRLGLFDKTRATICSELALADESENQISINYEIVKRLAYFVFALDVEHALFFGHERSILSVYTIKLELPAEEGIWHAPSPGVHSEPHDISRHTKFHALLHNLLSAAPNYTLLNRDATQLSEFLILLGLSAVALDFLGRQQDPFFNTKQALARLASVLPEIHGRLMTGPDDSMKTNGRAVYHITAIALCTPLKDLERAANDGFSRTGRTSKQHTRAAIIRLLTRHKVEAEPARHAIHLLRLFLITPTSAGYSRYEPSALYFGVLALWAYIIGRVSDTIEDDPHYLPNESLRHSQSTDSLQSTQGAIAVILQGIEMAVAENDSLACRKQWRALVPHVTTRLEQRLNNNAQEYSQVLKSLSDNINV